MGHRWRKGRRAALGLVRGPSWRRLTHSRCTVFRRRRGLVERADPGRDPRASSRRRPAASRARDRRAVRRAAGRAGAGITVSSWSRHGCSRVTTRGCAARRPPHHARWITTADLKTFCRATDASSSSTGRPPRGESLLLPGRVRRCAGAACCSRGWCALFLVPLSAIPAASAAMIATRPRTGVRRRQAPNELMLHMVFPLFARPGPEHWKHKHNHRITPTRTWSGTARRTSTSCRWPFRAAPRSSVPFRRMFQRRFQVYMFWPLTLFLAFMDAAGQLALRRPARPQRGFDRASRSNVACLVAHYTLWLVVPSILFARSRSSPSTPGCGGRRAAPGPRLRAGSHGPAGPRRQGERLGPPLETTRTSACRASCPGSFFIGPD